ncbi:ribbon-helix-helix domain-containing protein [Jannaschia formosa]
MPNISPTPQMQECAERQVEAGLYGNASEVVRAAGCAA